jgi:hypothetical protein
MSNQSILNRPMGKGWRTPFKGQGSGSHLGRVCGSAGVFLNKKKLFAKVLWFDLLST